MKLIGIKRALILAILLAINLAIAGLYFFAIEPMRNNASMQLSSIEGEISGLQSKIQNVKRELDDFKRNLPKYEELNKVGFFNNQDRFELMRHLDAVKTKSDLVGFPFDVTEVRELPSTDAAASQSRLIYSRIALKDLPTMVDIDFFRFVDVMMETFPSHVRLNAFSIARVPNLDTAFLTQIRKREKTSAITAEATFDWMTIVAAPKENQPANGWGQ